MIIHKDNRRFMIVVGIIVIAILTFIILEVSKTTDGERIGATMTGMVDSTVETSEDLWDDTKETFDEYTVDRR